MRGDGPAAAASRYRRYRGVRATRDGFVFGKAPDRVLEDLDWRSVAEPDLRGSRRLRLRGGAGTWSTDRQGVGSRGDIGRWTGAAYRPKRSTDQPPGRHPARGSAGRAIWQLRGSHTPNTRSEPRVVTGHMMGAAEHSGVRDGQGRLRAVHQRTIKYRDADRNATSVGTEATPADPICPSNNIG